MKNFPESKIYRPIRDWLIEQSYDIYPEAWGHDIVALKGERIVVVEMKTSFTRGLCCQMMRAHFADQVYAAVPSCPRIASIEKCRKMAVGLLIVNGSVRVKVEPPIDNPHQWKPNHDRRVKLLRAWIPDTERIGGLPNLAGDGDAQRVARAVSAYRETHPGASWRDLFRDVPNHYANHNSMRQGQKACAERCDGK